MSTGPPSLPWSRNPWEALTQPELLGDVPKTVGIVLPVPPEVSFSIHAALEHLEAGGGTISLWPRAQQPCPVQTPGLLTATHQPATPIGLHVTKDVQGPLAVAVEEDGGGP